MDIAFEEAEIALNSREVPVGCAFVDSRSNEVISRGHNSPNDSYNPTNHAEIVAVQAYLSTGGDISIFQYCDLYVTVEPCIMCASILSKIKIRKVYFGCSNDKFGGCGSILSLHDNSIYKDAAYHVYPIEKGIQAERATKLLQLFFERGNERAPNPKPRKVKPSSTQKADELNG
jgi:tRNA-specific adenosine deaminase 2